MSRRAQAWRTAFKAPSGKAIPALLGIWLLSGCAGGNILKQAEIDASLVTGSVPVNAAEDTEAHADAAAIRNAVTSANLDALGGAKIPWANPATGARGAITELAESRKDNQLCRRFTVSRESFDGVHLYRGGTCLNATGRWAMVAFDDSDNKRITFSQR